MADVTIAPGEPGLVPLEYLNLPCAGTPSDPMPLGGDARRPCLDTVREPAPPAVREAIAPLWAGGEEFVSGGYGGFRIASSGSAPDAALEFSAIVVVETGRDGTEIVVVEAGPPYTAAPAAVSLPASGALLLASLFLVGAAFRYRR